MTDLTETPDEHTQEWSLNARGCPQNAREPLPGTERGWICDRPSDCDVEPHGWEVIDGKAGGGAGYSTNSANGRRERLWLSPECITAHQDVLDFREATA